MSFGKRTSEPYEPAENQSAPRPRKPKYNWLRGGILCILLGVVNVIYYSQTGKTLLGPQSRGASSGFDLVMSVLVLAFGCVAVGIHLYRSRE
jgi:hypothetical protein